ncbi:MAG TPA: response regulator transcription factor [Actinomycetota bacterium]|nr:response regulator transcription factor [Actinomycetota bacterium]
MSNQTSVRIVIADDASDLRMLLKFGLTMGGEIEVVDEAGTGIEAVELTLKHRPDVVVLDISMPLMDGLQAAIEIKRQAPKTRIVIFSGFRDSELQEKALEAGADRYVEKNGDLEGLKRVVLQCAQAVPVSLSPGP